MKIRVSNKWHEVKLIVTSNGKTFGGEQLDKIQAVSEARGITAQAEGCTIAAQLLRKSKQLKQCTPVSD